MKLPEKFEERMKKLLKEEYQDYIESFEQPVFSGIRVNTLKLSPKEFEKITPFSLEPVPWTENGFYYNDEAAQPARNPYYYAGLYYIQEPSAMTPAAAFPIEPGERVLDMCAAPGGKSTELAAKLKGEGVLITNDISNSRAKALLKNIELSGVKNAIVMSENPKKLVNYFEGYFDKILIDAPCSGEGMFRKEPSMTKNWEEYGVDYYSAIQKEIILYGAKMLKKGGMMMYSTCTFSVEENEGTIAWLLEQCNDFTVERTELKNYFSEGYAVENQKESMGDCMRLWPHKIKGEGHFVTLLKKNGEDRKTEINIPAHKKLPECLTGFLKEISLSFDDRYFEFREDKVYYLPKNLPDLKGLRILRSGLYLGDIRKNRFEPSQAFASALKMGDYCRTISMTLKDTNVIKYLKGETIELETEGQDGWNLVCVDGYPLGWGKLSGTALKNKYYAGWRWL